MRTAALAGRVGQLLAREQAEPPPTLPASLAAHAGNLARASARLRAAGLQPPIDATSLQGIPPKKVAGVLARLQSTGLLDDGPGWALRVAAAPAVITHLNTQLLTDLGRQQEVER
jgi:hypothetical protein